MAKKIVKEKKERIRSRKSVLGAKKESKWNFPLGKKNMIYTLIGIGVILLGYALMATGMTEEAAIVDGTWNNPWAISVAPMLLVLGYCVIIPFAILKFFKKEEKTEA